MVMFSRHAVSERSVGRRGLVTLDVIWNQMCLSNTGLSIQIALNKMVLMKHNKKNLKCCTKISVFVALKHLFSYQTSSHFNNRLD